MKIFLSFFVPIFFLSLFVAATIYLSRRFGWFFGAESLKGYYWFFSVLVVGILAASMALTMSTSVIGHYLYVLSSVLMGFVTYLLIATLIVDGLGLIVNIKPIYSAWTSIGLAMIITVYGLVHAGYQGHLD